MKNDLHILVADDHPIVLRGLIDSLHDISGKTTVEGVSHLEDVLDLINKTQFDLILLDLLMPGMNGLDGFLQAQERSPVTPIAIISGIDDKDTIKNAIDMGAAGYIVKTSNVDLLINAVNLILSGGVYIPHEAFQENLRNSYIYPTEQPSVELSPRQKEILDLIHDGLSNKEVAKKLNLNLSTVKGHITALLKSLNVTSRTKAIRKTINWNLK